MSHQATNQSTEWVRQAMALNNAGVRLLAKGCVNQAIQVFDFVFFSLANGGNESHMTLSDALVQVEAALCVERRSENTTTLITPVIDGSEEMHYSALYEVSGTLSPMLLRDDVSEIGMSSAIYIMAVARYNHGTGLRCRFGSTSQRNLLTTSEQSLRTAKMLLWQNKEKLPDFHNAYEWDTALALINRSLNEVMCEQQLCTHLAEKNQPSLRRSVAPSRCGNMSYHKVQTRASAA